MSFSPRLLSRRFSYALFEGAKAHFRRALKARDLTPVFVRRALDDAHFIAVLVVRNEAPRFPYLLDYYRELGIEHFIVADNRSTDDLPELLSEHVDVSVYRAEGEYGRARYGNDWVNALLNRHAVGKWIIYVDADEFLVFDEARRNIPEVTARLEHSGRKSLQAMMLDMYSHDAPENNVVTEGVDPLTVCHLFDPDGYVTRYDDPSNTTWIKGGVRGRVFFPDDLWAGPALNKTPLVPWSRRFAFIKSAHELWPRSLNGGRHPVHAVLLHHKFTSSSVTKIVEPGLSAQHTSEYAAYSDVGTRKLVGPSTMEYTSSRDLTAAGLITPL